MSRFIRVLKDPETIDKAVQEQRARLELKGWPAEWSKLGKVFEDQYVSIHRDAVEFPSGTLGTYIRLGYGRGSHGGVVVVPRFREQIILVRHWRYALNKDGLEFPRGSIEEGESADAAAKRELMEEIGAVTSKVEPLGSVQPDTGLMNRPTEIIGVEVESIGQPQLEEGVLEAVTLTRSSLEEHIAAGQIADGFTLSAFAIATARSWI